MNDASGAEPPQDVSWQFVTSLIAQSLPDNSHECFHGFDPCVPVRNQFAVRSHWSTRISRRADSVFFNVRINVE